MVAQLRPVASRVSVTPMRRRHVRHVLAIERSVYPRPWSPSLFDSELSQGTTRRYFVALADTAPGRPAALRPARRVVGYAGALVQAGEAHVTTIAVDPAQHRRKVGSHLLVALLDAVRAMGAEAATLEVRLANRGAQRLYALFGFAPSGVRPAYYRETGEDALIMWAHDLQSAAFGERLDSQRARLAAPGGSSGAPDLPVPWVRGREGLYGPDDARPEEP
jgi:[ribosomal protein S18]-alanine N-acetyltransferase